MKITYPNGDKVDTAVSMDILDIAVERLAHDDYNHVPEDELRTRLLQIRGTRTETNLEEAADRFIAEVRDALTGWTPDEPEYGPEEQEHRAQPVADMRGAMYCGRCGKPTRQRPDGRFPIHASV